jgi:hypothetical protein
MLPAMKPRHKVITYRGEQRMLRGTQRMQRTGWRVVANTLSQPSATQARLPLAALGWLSARGLAPKVQYTVTFAWP